MHYHAGAALTEESERGLPRAFAAVQWACREPSERQIFRRDGCCVRFSDGPNKREERQGINFERDDSLDKALR